MSIQLMDVVLRAPQRLMGILAPLPVNAKGKFVLNKQAEAKQNCCVVEIQYANKYEYKYDL